MRRCLQLASKGLGLTYPNPMVGCVIVYDGKIIGEGWHQKAGGPHAEIAALREAGESARGKTAYVTLEPCSYHGRTPPCTDALLEAGIGHDRKDWKFHVTLYRKMRKPSSIMDPVAIEWPLNGFDLIESVSVGNGVEYHSIGHWKARS